MNKMIITGNITKDAEVIDLASGANLTKFCVAVNRKYKKEDGYTDTDFFNCTAFGKLGTDVIAKFGIKGQKVAIVGRMESNTKDNGGEKTTFWNLIVDEFELLGGKGADSKTSQKIVLEEVDDDSLPF